MVSKTKISYNALSTKCKELVFKIFRLSTIPFKIPSLVHVGTFLKHTAFFSACQNPAHEHTWELLCDLLILKRRRVLRTPPSFLACQKEVLHVVEKLTKLSVALRGTVSSKNTITCLFKHFTHNVSFCCA